MAMYFMMMMFVVLFCWSVYFMKKDDGFVSASFFMSGFILMSWVLSTNSYVASLTVSFMTLCQ
jgi:hypothetical protein